MADIIITSYRKSLFFEVLTLLIIFLFPLMREMAFGVRVLWSGGLWFSAGLFLILKYSENSPLLRDIIKCEEKILFFLILWSILIAIQNLFLKSSGDIFFLTLFTIPAFIICILPVSRMIRAWTLKKIYLFTVLIFGIAMYGLSGPEILFRINSPQIIQLFVDQYLTMLFFIFFYFFLPPLLMSVGRGDFEGSDLRPYRDFLKTLIPFQALLYFSHSALVISRASYSTRYLLSHYQIILILFLVIMACGGILLRKPSYKGYKKYKFDKLLPGERGDKKRIIKLIVGLLAGSYGIIRMPLTGIASVTGILFLAGFVMVEYYFKKGDMA
jgi:hypothetical protein